MVREQERSGSASPDSSTAAKVAGPLQHALEQADHEQALVVLESKPWTYRDPTFVTIDLDGFKVRATDGAIGIVDKASNECGPSYLIVKRSILGKKAMLPASTVLDVDPDARSLRIDRSREEIGPHRFFTPTRIAARPIAARSHDTTNCTEPFCRG